MDTFNWEEIPFVPQYHFAGFRDYIARFFVGIGVFFTFSIWNLLTFHNLIFKAIMIMLIKIICLSRYGFHSLFVSCNWSCGTVCFQFFCLHHMHSLLMAKKPRNIMVKTIMVFKFKSNWSFFVAQAFQFADEHGEVCPAKWKPGEKSMKPTKEGVSQYLSTMTLKVTTNKGFRVIFEIIKKKVLRV